MQKTFDTPEPVSLFVEIGSGTVTVQADHVTETVVTVRGKDEDDVTVEQRGDEIAVVARQRRSGFLGSDRSLEVTVTLPTDSDLATKLGSADLHVTGRIGEAVLKTGSGDVRVEQLAGDTSVETGSGDVSVEGAAANLRVKSGSGDVAIGRADGATSVSTGSGDVRVDHAAAALHVKSGSGDARVREAAHDVALSTASGELVVDRMPSGRLAAKNVSGDIHVGIPAGVPVWTDVVTMTGAVRSDLEGAGEPAEGQPHVELRAKTVSGDIVLEQL